MTLVSQEPGNVRPAEKAVAASRRSQGLDQPRRWRGTSVPAILALASGLVLWSSREPRETFGPSSSDIIAAGAVPTALFGVLFLLCVKQLVVGLASKTPEDSDAAHETFAWRRTGVFFLWFGTCILLAQVMLSIDLTLSVVLFSTGWAYFAGQRSRIGLCVVGLTAAGIVNVLVYFTNSPVASFL